MRRLIVAVACVLSGPGLASAQIAPYSGAGAAPADITAVRDVFRADLGGGTVAGANGGFGGLRREINWDGVPAASAAPNFLPANFFNVNSPRGVLFFTPGTGFQASAATTDASGAPVEFGNINPAYVVSFQVFTPQRLFTPLGSNILDVAFVVPGTNTPADVRGFGLVLTDVDVAGATTLRFFDAANASLGVLSAPAFNQGLSFVGGIIGNGQPRIARVRVTLGNATLGPADNGGSVDVVVADDFIYGEPSPAPLFHDGFE
jgi:hypothetical protein